MSRNSTKIKDIADILYQPVSDFRLFREKSALILVNFIDYVDFFARIVTEAGMSDVDADMMLSEFDARAKEAAKNAGELLRLWREAGSEIFHVKTEAGNDKKGTGSKRIVKTGLKIPSDSSNLAFYEAVKPRKGELVFSQENLHAFASSNLDFVLRNMNIDTLAICGLMTDQSVLFNTVQAVNLGYHVIVLEDACTSLTVETHAAFIKWYKTFTNVKSTKEIIEIIKKETDASGQDQN